MKIVSQIYEKIARRKAPRGIRENSLRGIVWKMFRKWLCISVIPFCPFNFLRIWLYRFIGFKIGKRVFIGMQCYMDDFNPSDTSIEDEVYISYRVTFATHGPRMHKRSCTIQKGCYIGANATILGGVTIGYYAMVGACTLVNKDVLPFTTVVGIPARVIRTGRTPWEFNEQIVEELKKKYLHTTE